MKTFVAAALISLASVASAQLDNIPSCALSCFLTPLGSDGCAQLTDFACHCKKFDALISAVTPCVQKACSASDQASVISGVEGTCKAAGVTVSVPSSAVASSTSSPASSSASASASVTESSVSTTTSSAASSSAPSSAVSGSPSASSNGTSPTGSPTPTSPTFPGAASRFGPVVGVVGAAAIAFLAL
ncbi:CFEM-domain-containing protein [Massarina eburnea CBS 473.64]|uniref:CFEM-domain-containing protein n=1 Tax=Massarina eburnea CBS 473.64 TaxID=1395130 RepID=A0A6A6RUI0_9PLEO|nr:CFEM-domain-containing protein [Massarina eburnea CBS 473.64]